MFCLSMQILNLKQKNYCEMKNKTYACVSLCFFAFSLFLWSCSDMELPGEHPPSEHQSFTLQDAKNYFRESTMNLVTARSTYEDKSI